MILSPDLRKTKIGSHSQSFLHAGNLAAAGDPEVAPRTGVLFMVRHIFAYVGPGSPPRMEGVRVDAHWLLARCSVVKEPEVPPARERKGLPRSVPPRSGSNAAVVPPARAVVKQVSGRVPRRRRWQDENPDQIETTVASTCSRLLHHGGSGSATGSAHPCGAKWGRQPESRIASPKK